MRLASYQGRDGTGRAYRIERRLPRCDARLDSHSYSRSSNASRDCPQADCAAFKIRTRLGYDFVWSDDRDALLKAEDSSTADCNHQCISISYAHGIQCEAKLEPTSSPFHSQKRKSQPPPPLPHPPSARVSYIAP